MRPAVWLFLLTSSAVFSQNTSQTIPNVLTYHNDLARSGSNQNETHLTLTNVAPGTFGKLFSHQVDGAIYGQPLYVAGLKVNGVVHNTVFVATENNSVYAFDADTAGAPLWHINTNVGAAGVTVSAVSSNDVNCGDLQPVIGITGTPVIDVGTFTMYVVSKTKEVSSSGTNFYQRLYGINISTGKQAFPRVTIGASVPGSCGIVQSGKVVFNALIQNQRAALLLVDHILYIGYASHCDQGQYNGWLLGYDTRTRQQVAVLNTTPDDTTGECKGGIWQSGGGPAVDSQGYLYTLTGNGGFNANAGGKSYGDSLLKLSVGGTGALSIGDYFTPSDQATLNQEDLDFAGSGAAVMLNNQAGPYPHLMVVAGKQGTIYLINRDQLGGYSSSTDHVVQMLPRAIGDGSGAYPPPVYFQEKVYFAASYDRVKSFELTSGRFNTTPHAVSSTAFGYQGAGLSLSALGGSNAILWALEGTASTGLLHAYNAQTLAELYNTAMVKNGADNPGSAVKFSVPTVANGKVYVGTQNSIVVYGLKAK